MSAPKDWVLAIDDDEQLAEIICLTLESEGFGVRTCSSPARAIEWIERPEPYPPFSVVLLDLRLGKENGMTLLPRIRELQPNLPVFIITAHGDVDSAVEAFTLGAHGYIRKPFREGELKGQISQAIETYRLRQEASARPASPGDQEDVRAIIRSRDPAMELVLRRVAMAATVTSNVVITGESGTGKELVARALHRCGPRRKGPFVAFNCAALPETLLESELFGYARGAFTDAKDNKPGLFARADGGTLFLDEIGDAPPSIQAKLLRVLQEREILPLGATTPIKIDVRLVAATHKSLQLEVEQRRFRQDLYYRLHVLPIHVPALRERPKDIPFLGFIFASRLAGQMGLEFEGFTATAERAMLEHSWPGNVRELQNRVEHAMALGGGGWLTAKGLLPEMDFGLELTEGENAGEAAEEPSGAGPDAPEGLPTFFEAKNSFERTYLEKLLTAARGNIARAARLASKSRAEVYSLLRKHGMDAGAFKERS